MGTFFSPFTIEECILGLTNSLKHHPFHPQRFFVDELHFPPNTSIEIYGRKQLNFMQIDDSLNVSLFIITESSICEAFYDFASSLETSEYILSEEISSQIIKQHLTDLKIATSQSENLL